MLLFSFYIQQGLFWTLQLHAPVFCILYLFYLVVLSFFRSIPEAEKTFLMWYLILWLQPVRPSLIFHWVLIILLRSKIFIVSLCCLSPWLIDGGFLTGCFWSFYLLPFALALFLIYFLTHLFGLLLINFLFLARLPMLSIRAEALQVLGWFFKLKPPLESFLDHPFDQCFQGSI